MRLVERDEHLWRLRRLLSESTEEKGHVVLLEGSAGSGKTELLGEVASAAAHDGILVLTATCSAAESDLPFGALSQLFHSARLSADMTDRAARLLKVIPPSAPAQDAVALPAGQDAARAYRELGLALLELAAGTPTVIVVDDVQHADTQSQLCLLYVARRLGAAHLLVVLAGDEDTQQPQSSFHRELLRQPSFHHLSLAPLSLPGIVELLAERLGDPAAAHRLATEFRCASGGNMLLLSTLIEDHLKGGAARPGGYGRAVQSCLYRSGPVVLEVARALAILDEHATPERTARLAGVDIETADRALHTMTAAGLLHNGHFRHPLGWRAALDTVPAPDRPGLHHRAAQLLHDLAQPVLAVAHHLAEAGRSDEPWGVPVLVEAAAESVLAERTGLAARYLGVACRSCTGDRERAAIQAKLAQAEWWGNPLGAGQHLAPLMAAVRADQLDCSEGAWLIRQLLWYGRADEAVEVLTWLRDSAHDGEQGADRTEVHDVEAWLAFSHPPLARRRRPPVTPHPQNADLTSSTDPWLGSAAFLSEGLTRGHSGQTTDRAEQVLHDLRLRHSTSWEEESATLALLVLLHADKPDAALNWCDTLLNGVDSRQASTWQAVCSSVRAEAALRQGDLVTAMDSARQALVYLSPQAWGVAIGSILGSLILASTRAGNYDEAARSLIHTVPETMFQSRYGLYYLYARGHFYLATNHWHAGLADFLSCGKLIREWGLDVAETVPWRTSAAEAWLRLGNREQARQLVQEQLGRPGTASSHGRGLSLRLLAAVSAADRRPHLLGEALDLFEESGDRYEQARVLADLSCAYSALGESRRARMALRRARHLAELCGATPLCEELLAVPEVADSTPLGPEGEGKEVNLLTDSERRVALLVVRGYTNRDIAAKLYVTPSTVEQHLTHVYRKLSVTRRKDLPVDLDAEISKDSDLRNPVLDLR
jgi:DNA-binding CsgD family transcriptional regulator/tetratricopeptide (TPR) repeat protein